MTREEAISRIAISFLPEMKASIARSIMSAGITPEEFIGFGLSPETLPKVCQPLKSLLNHVPEALKRAEEEYAFASGHNIRIYSLFDEDYPWLLRQIPDAPVVLYKLGNLDLNMDHVIAMVGTRRCTAYGSGFCQKLVGELADELAGLIVVSGLAYGIDAASHIAALENNVPTCAVVAHGLDMIYPSSHRDLARRIIKSGGAIISEYPSHTTPFAGRFLERNRIVAGLSHLTLVVESEVKGGAMSTANSAFSYSREVAALPGRNTDKASGGCNLLIRKNKASLVTSAADIMELMSWQSKIRKIEPKPSNLFPELEGDAAVIYDFLKNCCEPVTIDILHSGTKIAVPQLMAALTEMEFDAIVQRQPGNRYCLA